MLQKSMLHSHVLRSVINFTRNRLGSSFNVSNAIFFVAHVSCFSLEAANHRAVWTSTQIAKSANRISVIEVLDKIREQFFREQSVGLPFERIERI